MGTHLAKGYSSGDPQNHYKYKQHNHRQSQQSNLYYTHTLWSVAALFFQVIQGCRAGFEPRTFHSSCSASSLKLPLSHPCTQLDLISCHWQVVLKESLVFGNNGRRQKISLENLTIQSHAAVYTTPYIHPKLIHC